MSQAVFSRAWALPKDGSTTAQNEDACRYLRQQFAAAKALVRPLQEAGIPDSSRRSLMPWNYAFCTNSGELRNSSATVPGAASFNSK
jgi:hypothetical protein